MAVNAYMVYFPEISRHIEKKTVEKTDLYWPSRGVRGTTHSSLALAYISIL